MIDIDIDTQGLSNDLGLVKSEIDNLMQYTIEQLTAEFAYSWGMEAKKSLKATRKEYQDAILIGSRGRFTGVAYLNPAAWLPNALEVGLSAFDMKQGFLKSPKVKLNKKGEPFLTIPFRFASSGSVGESSAFSGILPPEIERSARASGRNGLQLKNISSKHQIPKSASLRKKMDSVTFKKMESNQKTSIYQGLKKTKGGFVNFRRVSLNSVKHSWNHPGFEARNFAQKALPKLDIEGIVGDAIDQFLENIGY